MKLLARWMTLAVVLALVTPLSAAEEIAGATEAKVEKSQSTTQERKFAIGVGYPDQRLRFDFGGRWSAEAKTSFLPGLQSYGARLNVGFFELGPVSLLAGTEAGWLKFDGIETVSGTGTFGQAYLGFEVPIGGRFKLEADAGPAIYQLNAEGQTVNASDLIFNAAFYLYVW